MIGDLTPVTALDPAAAPTPQAPQRQIVVSWEDDPRALPIALGVTAVVLVGVVLVGHALARFLEPA